MNFSSWKQLIEDIFFVATRDKKWWLIPLVLFVLVIALVLVIAALAGPLAPFIYPLV